MAKGFQIMVLPIVSSLVLTLALSACGSASSDTNESGSNALTSKEQTEQSVVDDAIESGQNGQSEDGNGDDGTSAGKTVLDEYVQAVDEWSNFPDLKVPDGWTQESIYDGAEVYIHGTDEDQYFHPDDPDYLYAQMRIYEGECLECLKKNFGAEEEQEANDAFDQGIIGTWEGWDVSRTITCPECNLDDPVNAERDVYKYWGRKSINGENHWICFWKVGHTELREDEIAWIMKQWFDGGKNDGIWETMQGVSNLGEAYAMQ